MKKIEPNHHAQSDRILIKFIMSYILKIF